MGLPPSPLPPPSPLLAFLLCLILASAADIPLNSTLYASDPNSRWVSSNNTFILSFIPSASAGTLIAAVSINTIPIWQAGPSANSSAVLRLLSSGDLQLLPSASSSTPLWSSATASLGVSAAELRESGNFVLKNSTGAAVWASFDRPTDTIVPSQQLNANHTLTSGLYSFQIKKNGNLTLLWNNTVTYYNSGLNSTYNSNLVPEGWGGHVILGSRRWRKAKSLSLDRRARRRRWKENWASVVDGGGATDGGGGGEARGGRR